MWSCCMIGTPPVWRAFELVFISRIRLLLRLDQCHDSVKVFIGNLVHDRRPLNHVI